MALGNLQKDLKLWRKARAGSIWRWGGGRKAEEEGLKAIRAEIIGDVLKLIRQHKKQVGCKPHLTPVGALHELIEAVEKLKD